MPTLEPGELLNIPTFPKHLKEINAELEKSLVDADPIIRDAAMRHVLAPSKRLRPAVVLAVVHAMGKPINKKAIRASTALELAHISSLIHDDIIDEAGSRHGIPTINTQEGTSQAIIAGDFVLAAACAEAALVNVTTSRVVAHAIGRICDGQAQEVVDQYNVERDGASMLNSIRGKTAALFAAAAQVGGICANMSDTELAALALYGEQFGMAFQLIDDVLDFVSSDTLLGKPTGNDVIEGVYTMPILLALHGHNQEAVREALVERSKPTPAFTELLIDEYAIGKTIEVAKQFTAQAVQTLRTLSTPGSDLTSLTMFPDAYISWSLANLVAPEYRQKLANL